MNNQKILIYDFDILYQILNELKKEINFEIININTKDFSSLEKVDDDSLIITKKEISNIKNQLIISKLPIRFFKLIEQLNLSFLKQKFNEQSEFIVKNYKINLNSREMIFNSIKLKLTEKETNIIIFLSKSNKPVNIQQLQSEVWGYHSELETHTVETHIYRLRKKIHASFGDEKFIISEKDGYKIL